MACQQLLGTVRDPAHYHHEIQLKPENMAVSPNEEAFIISHGWLLQFRT